MPRTPSDFSADNAWSFAVAAGDGCDHYIEQNIALGFEVRHTALFDVDMNFAGRR